MFLEENFYPSIIAEKARDWKSFWQNIRKKKELRIDLCRFVVDFQKIAKYFDL